MTSGIYFGTKILKAQFASNSCLC